MRVPRKQTLNPTRTELKGREEKRRTCHPGGESHAATAACARRADLLLRHSWRAEGDASTGALANNAGGEECCWLWRSPLTLLSPVACSQTGISAQASSFSQVLLPSPSRILSTATSDFSTATSDLGTAISDCSAVTLEALTPTLEFVYVLNVGIVHEGTPFSDFLYFRSPTCSFWHFFYKIRIYDPHLVSLGDPIPGIHSMGRGSLIFEGAHTNKTIGARFYYYGLSRIQDICEL
jgi:hypothetical protein